MELKITSSKRTETGKNAAGRLRRQGVIPANLIAEGKSEMIQIKDADFRKLLTSGLRQSSIIDITHDNGTSEKVIVKEIHRHPVTSNILHVDFYRVRPQKKVRVNVAVETFGMAKGVKAGGALEHFIRVLKVSATPESLIDVLKVDVTSLDVGQAIHLDQIGVPAEWEVKVEGNPIVCKIARSRLTQEKGAEAKAG
jgi:large subunit ribosomal protein L25